MKLLNFNAIAPFLLFAGSSYSQEQFTLTPEKQIKLVSRPLNVPVKYRNAFPNDHSLNVPEGFKVSVYYAGGLQKGRFMSWGPDSALYIANMSSGEIFALPDKNHDLVADTMIIAAKNAYGHDVKFFNGDMYVAEELKVEKFSDKDHDGYFETRSVFIDTILGGKLRPPGGHTTRTIVFDEKNKKVYLSVGSSCNICREEGRAVIFEYDLDGKNKRVFASGTRNCVGMSINPQTGKLWATNNGSDYQGDDTPPEWIDEIRNNAFYGYPFAFDNKIYFNFNLHDDYRRILPLTSADSMLVNTMVAPAASVQAHCAPMAIEFSNFSFVQNFKEGCFVAYRGSYERMPPVGYKVVYLKAGKNGKIASVTDVITGFLPSVTEKPWARPVGLAADRRGNLYMSSDDLEQFILVLSPDR
jgi:glucose/arabinose dehydrogenase